MKRGRSFSFFPRRKEGEDPETPLTRHVSVTYETLEALFHLPLKDAARELCLCQTTFKKACRSFNIEEWPFRKGRGRIPLAREDSQTDGVDAAIGTLHQEPVCAPVPPTLETTEVHQAMRAVTVSCSSPGWYYAGSGHEYDGSSSPRNTSALSFPFSANDSCRSTVPDPFGAGFSSAPQGLLQQASMAFDTRSCGEARHAGPAFQHKTFATLDAPSFIDSSPMCRVVVGVPLPLPQGLSGPCGGEQGGATPLEAGPPRERPCVEAVMEYLDGPLARNFDFMFADEEGAP
jgi:hypothetical protein